MTVAVRQLGIADALLLEELLDVVEPGWADARAPGSSGPIAFSADPSTFVFGAYADQEPAGWVWGVHVRRPDGRTMTYVHELGVVDAYRRRGIATMLMEAAIGEARSHRSHKLWLVTRERNEAAQTLYAGLGGDTSDGLGLVYRWDL